MKFKKLKQSEMGQMFRPKGVLYELATRNRELEASLVESVGLMCDKLRSAFGPGIQYGLVEEVVPQNPKMCDFEVTENTWYWSMNDDHYYIDLYLTNDKQLAFLAMSMSDITTEGETVG